MTRVRNTHNRNIITGLLVFSLLASGSQGAHAALLDGMLDTVEESLAKGLAEKNERLTTGNFYTNASPNAHGPIGMMGEHTHEAGEVMFSYRLMHMWMHGTRNGANRITNTEALDLGPRYLVVPESMRMIMHMFGFMYGWNDTVTLSVMVPYILKSMNHANRRGEKFTTRSEGVGDLRFGSLWRLWAVEAPSLGAHRFHANFSVSVPTGNIQPADSTPLQPNGQRLPYPMHLGSGTVDFYPGVTYGGEMGQASWGFQTIGTLRVGRNVNGFSKGDAYQVNVHGAYAIMKDWLSGSVRLSWNDWGAYDGADQDIANRPPPGAISMFMVNRTVQTGEPNLLGGQRLDVLGGINVLLPEIMGLETRLAVEGGVPIYQYLDGQLETDSIVTFGLQGVY